MAGHSSPKIISSMKTPSSFLSSTKLKTFIFYHISKLKSVLIQLLKIVLRKTSKSKQKNLFFGSFRLYYNWCSSSRTVPVMLRSCPDDGMQDSGELSQYLQWLEEKECDGDSSNEIDRLADLFIADCHEKFRLEKEESYRRFQEMMARSV